MFRDIGFEAAFLRAGLLVGLVHEREVPGWAADAMERFPGAIAPLADVVLAPIELSAMREALRPMGEAVGADRVGAALLIALAMEPATAGRSMSGRLRILSQIRRDFPLPARTATAIKDFEDREMLAAAGVSRAVSPSAGELAMWLDGARLEGCFSFSFGQQDEAAAFVGALSRNVLRDRTWLDRPGACAWVIGASSGEPQTIVLNERAWQTARREFGPLPLASRIPFTSLPSDARVVFDEVDGAPLGLEEAQLAIAG